MARRRKRKINSTECPYYLGISISDDCRKRGGVLCRDCDGKGNLGGRSREQIVQDAYDLADNANRAEKRLKEDNKERFVFQDSEIFYRCRDDYNYY